MSDPKKKERDNHWQVDLDQSTKNNNCRKSTCNNKGLIEVNYDFDPDDSNLVRDNWNLIESEIEKKSNHLVLQNSQ